MVSKTIKTGVGSKIKYKLIKKGYKTINGTINVTEETSPSIPLVKPEIVYTSDLEYNVDTTVQHAPLVSNSNITLPDDEVLSQGNFLWYPYDDGKKYRCPKGTITKKDNFDRIGSVKISDGVANGFGANNYLRLPSLSFSNADSWEIKTKVTSSSDISTWQMIYQSCSGTGSAGRYGIIFAFQDGKFAMAASSSNSGWLFDIVSTHAPLPNTTYYIKAEFDGTKYTLKYSTDDIDYTTAITYESTSKVYPSLPNSFIGIYSTSSFSQPFYGKIDLNETYIKINDEVVWKPEISDYELNATKVGSVSVDKDWIASGFSGTSNYLTPTKSIVFTDNIEYYIKIKTGTDISTFQNFFMGLREAYIENGKISIWNDEQVWCGTVEANKWYYIRFKLENNKLYLASSEDGIDYSNEVNCDYDPSGEGKYSISYGKGLYNDRYWRGSVDLSECYIKINGEKVWEGIKYQEYDTNYTIVGSPTISDKQVISNMTTSNYLDIPYLNMNSTSYEICCEFTLQNTYTDYRCFFVYGPANAYFNMAITNDAQPKVHSNTGNGSNWYTSIVGTTPLELNKSYLVKCCRVNGVRTMYLSADGGITWSNEGSATDTYSYSNTYHIGQAQSSNPSPNMSMDLTKCYVKINDEEVWHGAKEKSSYYQGLVENSSDYKPQGGTYRLYSYHKDNEDKLIATSSTLSLDCDYSQYIQDIVIPEFTEYQYDNNTETWTGVTDITLTLDQDDAEFSLEEVE